MIENQLKGRDITSPAVLKAMQQVEREDFVPEEMKEFAYEDSALPIGRGQTISQPYIVAYMCQALNLHKNDVVLEVGTGCGYNAAVMSKLVSHVYSLEVVEWLSEVAKENLQKAGIKNVTVKYGDGYKGWPEYAPFDAIVLTAAPLEVPEELKQQLKTGGKLIAPVGKNIQKLILLEKTGENSFEQKNLLMVSFVPMVHNGR